MASINCRWNLVCKKKIILKIMVEITWILISNWQSYPHNCPSSCKCVCIKHLTRLKNMNIRSNAERNRASSKSKTSFFTHLLYFQQYISQTIDFWSFEYITQKKWPAMEISWFFKLSSQCTYDKEKFRDFSAFVRKKLFLPRNMFFAFFGLKIKSLPHIYRNWVLQKQHLAQAIT